MGWTSIAGAEVVGCKTDESDRHRLLVIDNPNSPNPHVLRTFKGKIVESNPSPEGGYVGAMVVDPESRGSGLPTFTFYVMDARGRTVAQVAYAQGFSFSPEDRYVAVTTGRPYEGASGFEPVATKIVDLKTKRQWEVPELKDATEVDWTNLPEGMSLLAKKPLGEKKIWKYLVSRRKAAATNWKGLHFSPDGEYYYLTPREAIEAGMCEPGRKEDSCLRAFSRRGKELKLRLKKRFRRAMGWSGRNGHELIVREGLGKQEEEMEIDLASGRMRVLKERLNKKWHLRRGAQLIEEKKGKLRIRVNDMFRELRKQREERQKRRRSNY
ncbi:MAG: hypothetical protein AAF449_09700 [Myxococcota bacterium]